MKRDNAPRQPGGKLPANHWEQLDFKNAIAYVLNTSMRDEVAELVAAMKKQENEQQKNNTIHLERGDIILYIDKGYFAGVAIGQGAMRVVHAGNAAHADPVGITERGVNAHGIDRICVIY